MTDDRMAGTIFATAQAVEHLHNEMHDARNAIPDDTAARATACAALKRAIRLLDEANIALHFAFEALSE